jgi:hypothetical protein
LLDGFLAAGAISSRIAAAMSSATAGWRGSSTSAKSPTPREVRQRSRMPSLDVLEYAVAQGQREDAALEVLRILKSIDDRYGRLDGIEGVALAPDRRALQIATRFCAAFGRLITDTSVIFSPVTYEQLCAAHRWLELLFCASGFGTSDYLVPQLAVGEFGARRVPPEHVSRFLLIFSAAFGMAMNFDESLATDPAATIPACLGYLASRFCFTDAAHALREQLLQWLPDKLSQVRLGAISLRNIASPYMHCSYAVTPAKHLIKAPLMAHMKVACLEGGAVEMAEPPPPAARPTIVVTCENFNEGHSVHRTHSLAVEALKADFHVVGYIPEAQISPAVEACFHELRPYNVEGGFLPTIERTSREIVDLKPALVFHLGVGMSPYVIALASLRLAPVQAASFGHTATTMSPAIDYMILPEDFIGDPACFAERLVAVAPAAMPYRPRRGTDYAALRAEAEAKRDLAAAGVRIAVPASVMKLGPPLFDALARAAAASSRPVTFEIFPLGSAGLAHNELSRRLAARLPMAVVNYELDYDDYIRRLAACDFFVCPFPYGNMNSIIDAVLVGLPGVCLDGPEAHAHADAAYFARMRFPPELTTRSVDAYVSATVRLASDPAWLARCRQAAAGADLDAAFFKGDASLFASAVKGLLAPAAASTA